MDNGEDDDGGDIIEYLKKEVVNEVGETETTKKVIQLEVLNPGKHLIRCFLLTKT